MDFGDCPSRGDDPFTWAANNIPSMNQPVEADRGCFFFRRKKSLRVWCEIPGIFRDLAVWGLGWSSLIFYHHEKKQGLLLHTINGGYFSSFNERNNRALVSTSCTHACAPPRGWKRLRPGSGPAAARHWSHQPCTPSSRAARVAPQSISNSATVKHGTTRTQGEVARCSTRAVGPTQTHQQIFW